MSIQEAYNEPLIVGANMYDRCAKDTYATLVDRRGHFIDTLGRVAEVGNLLKIVDGPRIEYYDRNFLLDTIQDAGLRLVFLPPGVRLPKAPIRVSEEVYSRLAEARRAITRQESP